jgi:phosphatidylglycerophosphate synthase
MSESKYVYESHQDSILRPYYQRFLWNAILDALPEWLAPNTMTLIATLACALSFVLAATLGHHPLALLVCAFLILTYLTLDNLDGAQARKYGRSSHLGEFLDHWLDTINNGFVFLGACLAAGLPSGLTLAVLACGTLAFYSVQWELRATGVFRMGRIADIEGNTTVALLYVAIAVLGRDLFHTVPVEGGPSIAVLIGVGVMGQALMTLSAAVTRVSEHRGDYVPVVIAHAILLIWAYQGGLSAPVYLGIALFMNPVFTTRPIFIRLLQRDTKALDWTVVAALMLLALASELGLLGVGSALPGMIALLGLASVTAWYCLTAVTSLRQAPEQA